MKTSQGKLAALAFVLLLAAVLFLPMRVGLEDELIFQPRELRMCVGDSYTVRCALSSENMNQRVQFSSDDQRVARIGLDGTVYASGSGETRIRARASGGASAEMLVKVAGVPLTELSLNVDEITIEKGEYSGLRANFNTDASDTRLRWLTSDERIVRVDSAGRVEGVGGGDAYVSVVTSNGMSASARVHVKVAGTAVHISPNQLTLGVGARVPLKASYLPLDCTDQVRSWISSNPTVLAVSDAGIIEARNPGSAYVTVVTEDGLTTGMEVVVEPAPKELQLDPSRATLERGDTMQMQLMFLEEDGSVETTTPHLVTWSSNDPSVASVDANGLVTALRSGTCRIEAESDGMVASCRLNVQVTIHTITLDQSELYLLREDAGTPIQLNASYAPEDPDDPTIIYTSNNEQVARVDQTGLVSLTGGYGTAVITASAGSGAQAEFTVSVVTQLPSDEAPEEEFPSDEVEAFPEEGEESFPDEGAESFPDEGAESFPEDGTGDFPTEEFPADGDASVWGGEDEYGDDVAPVWSGEDEYGDSAGAAEITQEPVATPAPTVVFAVTPVPNVTQEPYSPPLADVTVDPETRSIWN